jgi:outer membrane protein OmpA-like peptidoglycan-associated protein
MATGMGFWEDADQLNLIAAFLDPKAIGAVSCCCRFARDNLRDANALRWLAELRGLDPATTHIACVAHIELAETMAELETSIGFDRGSVEIQVSAMPSIRKVVHMLRRHTALTLSIEAHCGLDAHPDFARAFAQRRATSVRRTMETVAEEDGGAGSLNGQHASDIHKLRTFKKIYG